MAKDTPPPQPLTSLDPLKAGTFLPRQGDARAYRAQGLAKLMPGLTRKVAGKRPTLVSDLQANWDTIVGQDLARFTRPAKLVAGTLHLKMAQGVGPVISMHQEKILAHVGRYLGADRVARLTLHQVDMPLPDPEPRQESVIHDADPLTSTSNPVSAPISVGAAFDRLRARLDAAKS